MKALKFNNVNVESLKRLVAQMSVFDQSIYMTWGREHITAMSVTLRQDKIKRLRWNTADILPSQMLETEGGKPLVINFVQSGKLKKILSQFSGNVDMEVAYAIREDDGALYALSVTFSDCDVKLTEKTVDMNYQERMPTEEQMRGLIDGDNNVSVSLTADKIRRIKALGSINKDNPAIEFSLCDGGLIVSEYDDIDKYCANKKSIYDFIVSQTDVRGAFAVSFSKDLFDALGGEQEVLFKINGATEGEGGLSRAVLQSQGESFSSDIIISAMVKDNI